MKSLFVQLLLLLLLLLLFIIVVIIIINMYIQYTSWCICTPIGSIEGLERSAIKDVWFQREIWLDILITT